MIRPENHFANRSEWLRASAVLRICVRGTFAIFAPVMVGYPFETSVN